ncbi:MAG: hypothetical protein ABIH03_08045 [Pseudomonadota bacterium]
MEAHHRTHRRKGVVMAKAALFPASEESARVNGAELVFHGGKAP